jgi:CHASE3 domain sensor protein
MADDKQQLLPPVKEQQQLDLFANALEVERERIRSQDRRTEAVRAAIEANNASDKRQFEFHMARLEEEKQQRINKDGVERSKIGLARMIVLLFGSFAILVTFGLLYFLFFGTPDQVSTAQSLLSTGGKGVGGFGAIYAIISAVKALIGKK